MKKIAIVGGGIIGLTSAWQLARQGFNVTLFEAQDLCGVASSAAGGILSPLKPWESSKGTAALWKLSLKAWQACLAELRPFGIRLYDHGALYLGDDMLQAAARWAQLEAYTGAVFDGNALKQKGLQVDCQQGYWLQGIQHVEMMDLLNALIIVLRQHRVTFRKMHAQVFGKNGRVFGVGNQAQHDKFDKVIICAGCWSQQVQYYDAGQPMSLMPKAWITPKRGQMIQYAGPSMDRYPLIISKEFYLIGRSHRRVLVGSTVEDCGFDSTTSNQAQTLLGEFAKKVLPCLKGSPIQKHWAGLRPEFVRDEPLIAEHPSIKGLFFNTGHFRNGVGLASGSARVLVSLVKGEQAEVNEDCFAYKA